MGIPMKRFIFQMTAVLVTAQAGAQQMRELPGGRGASLLEKNCIETGTAGLLPAPFEEVAGYLRRPDLVECLQAAYRRSVSKDGTLDYPIIQDGPCSYHYINEDGRRTDLTELYRGRTAEGRYELVYHASGRRFFGRYEVLIHVRLFDAGPAGTAYSAQVHAYPHNAPLRFLARRFGTVERYFQRKTRIITRVSEKISMGLGHPRPYGITFADPAWLPAQ
jgi:hypothetical protein